VADAVVRLPDGRRMAVGEAGDPRGTPVLYLHGAIGSPVGGDAALGGVLGALGIRLLAVQRPGFGGSCPSPGRSVACFGRDAVAVADALGLDRVAVLGVSAGGPYALASAGALGRRVTATALVSSLTPQPVGGPADAPRGLRVPLGLLRRHPERCAGAGDALLRRARRHPGVIRRVAACAAPRAARGDLGDCTRPADAFLAATAHGVAGLVEDHLVTSRPWGLELGRVPGRVDLWHGARDPLVPAYAALQLAAALPVCRVWVDPVEGHFFLRRRAADVLAAHRPASIRRYAAAGWSSRTRGELPAPLRYSRSVEPS
jgi:pimeloyl-ACP methyl ester carboxylesterase